MQWVELMGPHGIGKTTINHHLRKFMVQSKHPVRGRDLRHLVDGWDFNRPTTWPLPQWCEFLEIIEELYHKSVDSKRPDFKRRRNLCRTVMRMSVIDKLDVDWLGFMDLLGSEGMRLSYQLKNPSNIADYFKTMPVSFGVVVLEADIDVIKKRNKARVNKAPNFGALAERGIEACSIAANVLADRTKVLRLDAAQPIDDTARAIAAFANL